MPKMKAHKKIGLSIENPKVLPEFPKKIYDKICRANYVIEILRDNTK